MGNQVPRIIKGLHDGRLQGPLLSRCQVLCQLLQVGHTQYDSVPEGTLKGETARC